MRIPPEQAVLGGNSDCRNRRLQTMFQLVGYGDHAGSGLTKIYQNWAGQRWLRPVLHEVRDPEQTLMELLMTSLVPPEVLGQLTDRWGERFLALSETARLALVTALIEGAVHHGRLKEVSADHPSDLTKLLAHLVSEGFLVPEGSGRGTVYTLPGQSRVLSQELTAETQELGALSHEFRAVSQELEKLLWSEWDEIPVETAERFLALAAPVQETRRADREEIQRVIVALCKGHYLGIRVIAHLLRRDAQDLSRRHLKTLVDAGHLVRRYPRPNDPRQAYTTKDHP